MVGKTAVHIAEYSQILSQIINDVYENSFLKKFEAEHLTKTQFSILRILSSAGTNTVSGIADILQISRAAASKNIDKLVQGNLVSRNIIEKDRRNVEISLLKPGEKIVESYENLRLKKQNDALSKFSKGDRELFAEFLSRYVRNCLRQEKNIDAICMQCKGNIFDACAKNDFNQKCRFYIKNN